MEGVEPQGASVSIDEMIELGEEIVAAVREHTPDIVYEAGVTGGIISVRIINSRGREASYQKSIFSLGVGGTLIRGTDMLFVGESQSSCHPILDARAITGVVLHQLELAKNQASVPGREMPVIFTPAGVAHALTSPLLAALTVKVARVGPCTLRYQRGETDCYRK